MSKETRRRKQILLEEADAHRLKIAALHGVTYTNGYVPDPADGKPFLPGNPRDWVWEDETDDPEQASQEARACKHKTHSST